MTPRNHTEELKHPFEGNATRSEKAERYDLDPPEAATLVAERFGLGALKHGEGNWKQGGVAFIKATLNHARAHEAHLLLTCGESPDDDLAATICNWHMLAWFRGNKTAEYQQALKELRSGKVE